MDYKDFGSDKFNLGIALMREGKYEEAILKFNNANSSIDGAKVYKGICLLSLQRNLDAERSFKEVIDKQVDKYKDYYYKGIAYFYTGEYLQAIYYLNHYYYFIQKSNIGKSGYESKINLSYLEIKIGLTYLELAKNIKRFKDEILLCENIKCLDKWSDESQKLDEIKEVEEIEIINELKIDIDSLKKNGNLDSLSKNKTLRKEIVSFCDKWIYKMNHDAIKFLLKGISQEDDTFWFFYNKGVALSNIGKFQDAIDAFNEAIERYYSDSLNVNTKRYAVAFNNKGNTYVQIEKYEDAIKAYTEAIKINPEYSIAYNNRGQAYFNLKNYIKALDDFNESIKSNPANYNAWTNRGTVFFIQKKYVKAKEAFEKALDLNPSYPLANIYLARLLLNLGNYKEANEKIDKTLDQNVRNTDFWQLKGQILLECKKYEEAMTAFENAIQCPKGDESFILWKVYAHYLKVYDSEFPDLPKYNSKDKTKVIKYSENIFAADKQNVNKISDISKKINNHLPPKSKNSHRFSINPNTKINESSKSKMEYYSIIRELEMYFCISCKHEDFNTHITFEKLNDFNFWARKNVQLIFLPIMKYLVKFNFFKSKMPSINLTLKEYEIDNKKSYVLYYLGCLYYKIGDYFEAKEKLEECMKVGPKELRKSAAQLLDHISTYHNTFWWTWWLSSSTHQWTKRIIFSFLFGIFVFLLLLHLLITVKPDDIYPNWDFTRLNLTLYYILISIPLFILFSPNIARLVVKQGPLEVEMKSPKELEFNLHPNLMDDIVRKIDVNDDSLPDSPILEEAETQANLLPDSPIPEESEMQASPFPEKEAVIALATV